MTQPAPDSPPTTPLDRPWLVLGAGGHGRVVADLLLALRASVLGFLDPGLAPGEPVGLGLVCLGDDGCLTDPRYAPGAVYVANGIGSLPGQAAPRRQAFARLAESGHLCPPLIHPMACLAHQVAVGDGAQVMAGAVLQTGARIGHGSIVNTGARVDHDCRIGAHVHLAPGVVLSGAVGVGEGAHLGTGCAVIQTITIGAGAVVAAGATVRRDLPPGTTFHPAKGTPEP
ncbi:NeuD/PglB/VioB family sugar acetyltransferase [Roseospirillum parvum]|uniref:UDP-perosamine 4-acetyltransferase n=1 Tax=Roseospirillum parvum TaxID=83401 RepID=A0A1G7UZY7_9PROT|nr:NeuD/PglB/VioB family sugar acetyltransferase [Roseospirillum parvum]SDG53103.1 UDP-perosamine 4-acetyltransferase [Roseospirillum parvum]